jgi:hypothetical protein
MRKEKMRTTKALLIVTILGGLILSACGSKASEETPTPSLDQIMTSAAETFVVVQTQTALAAPPTSTPAPTLTLAPTNTLGAPPISTLPTSTTGGGAVNTCNKLVYIQDVTIPDNTPMTPGQTFTKTWRVQNSGTCAWAAGYKFVLIGGDAMGGTALTLAAAVNPGAQFEISVPMTAPAGKTGKVDGTWRMSDAAGVFFGDALTVVIVIGGATSTATASTTSPSTATITPTTGAPTETPTASATPSVTPTSP